MGREWVGGRRGRGLLRVALPIALFLGQALWAHHSLVASGRVEPIKVPDTESYMRLAQTSSLDAALSNYRTYGYPLLLKIIGRKSLPAVELWIYLASSAALFAAAWSLSTSAWVGLAAATPLFHAGVLPLLGRIQPDFVAYAFVLFAAAALLALVVRPRQLLLWLGLLLAVAFAYHLRPANLFLIAWLPVVGWCLAALRTGTWRRGWRWLAALLIVTWTPYLLYGGLRAARVGEFGLVAFGGYNLSGLAASLIDDALLEELPAVEARLARGILAQRSRRGWVPYDPRAGSTAWFEQYSDNIWRISVQTAKMRLRLEGTMEQPPGERPASLHIAVNGLLRRLSREVIRRRPGKYLTWVRDAQVEGWRQLGDSPWVVWPAILLALSALARWLGARVRPSRPAASQSPLASAGVGLVILGVSFFAANILLISLLSVPFLRYGYGAALFLPSALCGALAALWLDIAQRSISASTSGGSVGGGAA